VRVADRDEIRAAVVDALSRRPSADGLLPGELDGDFDVLGSGIVDSLEFIDLLMGIEEAVGRPLALEGLDFEALDTLDAIVGQLHELQGAVGVEAADGG
jgi:acyl carrier protein